MCLDSLLFILIQFILHQFSKTMQIHYLKYISLKVSNHTYINLIIYYIYYNTYVHYSESLRSSVLKS